MSESLLSQHFIANACALVEHDVGMAMPELRQPWWTWSGARPRGVWALEFEHQALAVARRFQVTLASRELEVDALGIGGVFVREGLRNQGLGTQLMQRLLGRLKLRTEPPAFVVLYAASDWYARFGFVPLGTAGDGPRLWGRSLRDDLRLVNEGGWSVTPAGGF